MKKIAKLLTFLFAFYASSSWSSEEKASIHKQKCARVAAEDLHEFHKQTHENNNNAARNRLQRRIDREQFLNR